MRASLTLLLQLKLMMMLMLMTKVMVCISAKVILDVDWQSPDMPAMHHEKTVQRN